MEDRVEIVARVAHAASNAYNTLIGDSPSPAWEEMTEMQRAGVRDGVILSWNNAPLERIHNDWCWTLRKEGWVYGQVKSLENKTHPCLVPYSKLPEVQRQKHRMFRAIARALKP